MAKIKGNKKNNTLKGKKKADQIYGLAGDDTLFGNGGNDKLFGGDGNDVLYGGLGDDILKGGAGNDLMIAGEGKETYIGGSGIDTVSYMNSKLAVEIELLFGIGTGGAQFAKFKSIENIDGSAFNDRIEGDNNANRLRGLNGNDYLKGHGGNDVLDGGAGNDQIEGGAGADTMIGGLGIDTLVYTKELSAAVINLVTGKGGGSAAGDTFSGFEIVYGTKFADTITGAGIGETLNGFLGNDTIYGGGGNDILIGDEGADKLYGGDGNDRLRPGDATKAEADQLFGGAGNDWVDYSDAGAAVQVNLRTGVGALRAEGDTYDSIENVQGSAYGDILVAGHNGRAYGGNGDDSIYDGTGTEILRGGRGSDTLSDIQFGEDGLRDIFVLENYGDGSFDTVVGFNSGGAATSDQFWLAKNMFAALSANAQGVLASGYFINAATNHNATAAHAQLIYQGNTKEIWYDADGTGAGGAVKIAVLNSGPATLVNADFRLVDI